MKKQFVILTYIAALFVGLLLSSATLAQGSANVPLLVNIDQYSAAGYSDCWGYTAGGREYALLGVRSGTSIIDITDTDNPVEIAFIPGSFSTWKDIKTYQHYAYVVNENGGGMQIIDLSGLPNTATLAGTYTGFNTSHNIYIDTTSAILLAEGNFLEPVRTLSLANPESPVQISDFGVECHDIFLQNDIAMVSEGGNGTIGFYNLANPAQPSLLTSLNIPAAGYVHNAWPTEDGHYMITTEETGGKTIKMWDISDLNNISMTDQILGPSGLAHNAHVKGDYVYVSHYADGLRIYDISNPNDIFEAGYYDTYGPPSSSYDGAWGAYPFFASGKVLISDQETGLYVVYFEGAVQGGNALLALDNDTLAFDTVRVEQQETLMLTLFNNGTAALDVSNITASDPAFTVDISTFSIPSGGSQMVQVTFSPTVVGPYSGHLNIASNAAGADTVSVYLEGYGGPAVGIEPGQLPQGFAVSQNYPNPFNPTTVIGYQLSAVSDVELSVYDLQGKKVRTLVAERQAAGSYQVTFNAAGLSSGTYFYHFRAGGFHKVQKMMLLK